MVVMSQSEELQPLFRDNSFSSENDPLSFVCDHELLHCEIEIHVDIVYL